MIKLFGGILLVLVVLVGVESFAQENQKKKSLRPSPMFWLLGGSQRRYDDYTDQYEKGRSPCTVRSGQNKVKWKVQNFNQMEHGKKPREYCRVGVESCDNIALIEKRFGHNQYELIDEEFECKDGVKNGAYRASKAVEIPKLLAKGVVKWIPDREILVEATFKDDQLINKSSHYPGHQGDRYDQHYEQGRLAEKVDYRGGRHVSSRSTIRNGQLHGLRREYYFRDGNEVLSREVSYVDGEIHGLVRHFHQAEGKTDLVSFEESYVEGTKHGLSKRYDLSGKVELEETYEKGKKVSWRSLNRFGKWDVTTREQVQADEQKRLRAQQEREEQERKLSEKYDLRDGGKLAVLAVSPALTAGWGGFHEGLSLDIGVLKEAAPGGSSRMVQGRYFSLGVRGIERPAYTVGFGWLATSNRKLKVSYSGFDGYIQGDVLVREGEVGGATLTFGVGAELIFLIGRMGYDSFSGLDILELGAGVKIPLASLKF